MKPQIILHRGVAELMMTAAERSIPAETGGILVGYHEGRSVVVIQATIVPPLRASKDRYTRLSERANESLQNFLRDRELDDPAGYVGEWHSHPGVSGPSSLDRTAIRELAFAVGGDVALIVVRPMHIPPFIGIVASQHTAKRARTLPAEITLVSPMEDPHTTAHES